MLRKGESRAQCSDHLLVVKYKDKRDVLLLTTIHGDGSALSTVRGTSTQVCKPDCVLGYNKNMGGVDLSDQLLQPYSALRKAKVWYKKLSVHIVQMAMLNAFLLSRCARHSDTSYLQFQEVVVKALLFGTREGAGPSTSGTEGARIVPGQHFPGEVPQTAKRGYVSTVRNGSVLAQDLKQITCKAMLVIARTGHEMLKGKRVIVTGASSGIGEQMAYHLAKMGSHILITARTEEKLKKVVEKCTKLGAASASYLSGSMDSMTFAKSVVHEAERLFGGLDMLILNHIGYTYFNFFDGNVDHIRELMEINFELCNHDSRSSANVKSKWWQLCRKVGSPLTVPYTTTKFALDGFFSSLRMEFYQQKVNVSITLCVISYIDTDSAVNTVSNVIRQPAAPKEECALEIIKGGALRQREVYYQYQATKIPLLLRDWAPEFLDYLVLKNYDVSALNRQLKYACTGAGARRKEEDVIIRRWDAPDRDAYRTGPQRDCPRGEAWENF
ncbi:unnamed protein product [Ranitomeya imitator]|uniref:PiggyBac transposable element-derived protein domain-containing protein n=1 Tax=Ranitomeya imitator TaxID=111125 RepID=A0ABN9M223_9NEOB|nr:unnamed protein product [Ranitomeya imitator]